MKAFYEDFWADMPDDPEPWQWEERRALLLGEVRPGDRVLDLGCGSGRFLAALGAGVEAIGVDISARALERASSNAPDATLMTLDRSGGLPLDRGSIDLVWCSETLEHVPDAGALMAETCRVLRPGGRLLVTTPFHGKVKSALIALTRFEQHFDPLGQHVRFFTTRSLSEVLAIAGFTSISVQAIGGRPVLRETLVARAVRD